MSGALSLTQAPPLSVPARFFVTGPLFGVAAGLLFALEAEAVTQSRWTLPTLAVVHLVTVGFMLQVMTGALLQFMPVAAGVDVWRPRLVASVVHPLLALGAALLVAGFLGAGTWARQGAAVVLCVAVAAFTVPVGIGLFRSPAIGPTLPALKLAVGGLVVTAGLGVTLAAGYGWALPVPLVELTHAHAAWGVVGWALTLLAAVSYLVVPMFQLTPPYPTAFAFWLPRALAAALVLWTAGVLLPAFVSTGGWLAAAPWLARLGGALGALGTVAFAGRTLLLQRKRRRKVVDTTFRSWRVGLAALTLAALLGGALSLWPQAPFRERLEVVTGVLLFGGAFPAVITGMLYKILPFLDWLHLMPRMQSAPTLQQVLPEKGARKQHAVFLAALALLLASCFWWPLARVAGLAFAAACAWLEWHLVSALLLYRRLSALAGPQPVARGQHEA